MYRPLTLQDKELIDAALKDHPIPLSDYSFTNLWMWNEHRHYQIAELDGFMCIKFDQTHLYPIGNGSRNKIIEELAPLVMRAIPESANLNYTLEEEPNRFDYIYKFEDLLELHGNKYQAKRNLIHQFTNEYDFEYRTITPDLLPAIKELEVKWYQENPDAGQEHQAVMRALDNYAHLSIFGGALIVNEKPIAYTFAEYLIEDMLVIHAEKALTAFKGAYQVINNQFLAHIKPVPYINREEDLGLPNLRKIKESYHPFRLEKKYQLTLTLSNISPLSH